MLPAGDPSGSGSGLLGMRVRHTADVSCPRSMVGRVIGKNGETIKALQTYTGALIQIDQSTDPTRVTISGTPHSLSLAISMVTDICKGTFKGFALLRQLIQPQRTGAGQPFGTSSMPQPRPVYAPGYGLIPPSQLYGSEEQQVLQAGSVPTMLGGRSQSTMVQPGFQYLQTAQVSDGPIMLTHTIGGQDGNTLLGSMPLQQLPMQQVYSSVPAAGGGFTTQVAYYPAHEFASAVGASNEQLFTSQQDSGARFSLQPSQMNPGLHSGSSILGSTSSNAPNSGSLHRAGVPSSLHRGASGTGWIESSLDNTMGQAAVNELLGTQGGGQAQAGSGQQQLVQVIGPEGKISYYLQAGDT